MYENHFGCQARPGHPGHASYYSATTHEHALAPYASGGRRRRRACSARRHRPAWGRPRLFIACGAARFGHDRRPDQQPPAWGVGGPAEPCRRLFDLGLAYEARDQSCAWPADFLLKNLGRGRRAVLSLRKPSIWTVFALEDLRLLGNLEAGKGKALQVIRVAQPVLMEKLAAHQLASFRAIGGRVSWTRSSRRGGRLLLHHLRAAGARRRPLFSDEALGCSPRQPGRSALLTGRPPGSDACPSLRGRGDRRRAALEALTLFGSTRPQKCRLGRVSHRAVTVRPGEREEQSARMRLSKRAPSWEREMHPTKVRRRPPCNIGDRAHRLLAPPDGRREVIETAAPLE